MHAQPHARPSTPRPQAPHRVRHAITTTFAPTPLAARAVALFTPLALALTLTSALTACAPKAEPGLAPDASAFSLERSDRFERPDLAFPIIVDIELDADLISITGRPGISEIALDHEARAAKDDMLEQVRVEHEWLPDGTLQIRAVGPQSDRPQRWSIARVDLFVPDAERVTVRTSDAKVFVTRVGRERPVGLEDPTPHRFVTASGNVSLADVDGAVAVRTSSGDITLTQGSGNAVITTASGDVSIDTRRGRVRTETSSGDITLLAASEPFDLTAHSGDITITLDTGFDGRVRAEADAGTVRNSRHAPDTDRDASTARTTSGNVTVIATN